MPYINLKPGQKVTVTINGYLDEVLLNAVKVSFGGGEQIEVFTETDDVAIAADETPRHWPPLPGDVWSMDPGDGPEMWAAFGQRDGRVAMGHMHVYELPWEEPDELLSRGEMRLVWRNGEVA